MCSYFLYNAYKQRMLSSTALTLDGVDIRSIKIMPFFIYICTKDVKQPATDIKSVYVSVKL